MIIRSNKDNPPLIRGLSYKLEGEGMNKKDILEKAKNNTLKTEKVFVSDWGVEVVVKQLSAKQYLDVSNDCLDGNQVDRKKFLNYAIISSVYDEDNEQIFDVNNLSILESMSADSYSSMVMAVTRLNNLDGNSKNLRKVN